MYFIVNIGEIATHYPSLYQTYTQEHIQPFIVRQLLSNNDNDLTDARVQAIHCMASFAKTYETVQDQFIAGIGKHVLQILFKIVKHDGEFTSHAEQLTPDQKANLDDNRKHVLIAAGEGLIELFNVSIYRRMILAPPNDAHTLHSHSDRRITQQIQRHQTHTYHTYALCEMNLLMEHLNKDVRHAYIHKLTEKFNLPPPKHIPYVC